MSEMRDCEKNLIEMLGSEINPDIVLFCKTLSDMINSFSISTNEMLDAITGNETAAARMSLISWYWIRTASEFYNKTQSYYDARNELAYKRCDALCKSQTGDLITQYTEDFRDCDFNYGIQTLEGKRKFEYIVSVYMIREHRTLQQTFTGYVFKYLTRVSQAFKSMTNEIGEDELGYMIMI